MDNIDIFLEILKELMNDNNLNQKELAEKIGVEPSAIVYWFNKTFSPRIVNLIRIAETFHCSVDYLLGLTDTKEFTPSKKQSDFLTRFDELERIKRLNDYRISKHCNLSNSTVSKWRRHNRYPESFVVIKLAELFECSIEYLIGRSEEL